MATLEKGSGGRAAGECAEEEEAATRARLSTAAFVSAHASSGPILSQRSPDAAEVPTSTSISASSVRVLPVPGGPCHSVKLWTIACAMARRWLLFSPGCRRSASRASARHASSRTQIGG